MGSRCRAAVWLVLSPSYMRRGAATGPGRRNVIAPVVWACPASPQRLSYVPRLGMLGWRCGGTAHLAAQGKEGLGYLESDNAPVPLEAQALAAPDPAATPRPATLALLTAARGCPSTGTQL